MCSQSLSQWQLTSVQIKELASGLNSAIQKLLKSIMMQLGVIPARYESQRFPGKPLIDILGKPMVVRTWEQVNLNLGCCDRSKGPGSHLIEDGYLCARGSKYSTAGGDREVNVMGIFCTFNPWCLRLHFSIGQI